MKECVDADMADLPPAGVGQEDLLLPGLLPTAIAPRRRDKRDSGLDGVALDDETARAMDGLADLMSGWRAQRPFSTHRCWSLVFIGSCICPVQTHCSTRWIMRMGVNAWTPCRGDWRGGVLSYTAWRRQRAFGPGCAADAGADRSVSGPTPPGSMLSNRVFGGRAGRWNFGLRFT